MRDEGKDIRGQGVGSQATQLTYIICVQQNFTEGSYKFDVLFKRPIIIISIFKPIFHWNLPLRRLIFA